MTTLSRSLIIGCSALALAACGADEIASPGTGGNVTIVTPAPAPAPTPTPTPTSGPVVTPASGCPTINDPAGLTDEGTISGPEGEWRVCATPERFTADTRLPQIDGLLYRLNGQVSVGNDGGPTADGNNPDVTLTIDPGVIIYASGSSFLNVERGNNIDAVGTADQPIIFTSRDNVLGLNNADSSGQWGGVVLSGTAPVTDCRQAGATPGTVNCDRLVEGSAQDNLFGGASPDDSSGALSYVQIRYSGFVLSGDSELQSLTTGGTGSNTQLSYIQSVNSSDDGVEFFGGEVNISNLIVAGAEDDSLDTDTGVKLNAQYVLVAQRAGVGDGVIEADSNNGLYQQTPRQDSRLVNATMIQRSDNDHAVRLRGATDFLIANSVIIDASASGAPCIRIDQAETIAAAGSGQPDENGPPRFESVALDCQTNFRDGSDGVTAADAEAAYDAGTGNTKDYTNTIQNGYLNGANEDGYTPIFDATALSSFFETVNFIGAVSATDDWTQGWTCDSSAVAFGNNTGACTSIPVL